MATEPVHVVRFGLIKCEVFRHDTKSGVRFNATVTRLYRNGTVWQQSKMFGRDDLLLVAKAIDTAHTWICQHAQTEAVVPPLESAE